MWKKARCCDWCVGYTGVDPFSRGVGWQGGRMPPLHGKGSHSLLYVIHSKGKYTNAAMWASVGRHRVIMEGCRCKGTRWNWTHTGQRKVLMQYWGEMCGDEQWWAFQLGLGLGPACTRGSISRGGTGPLGLQLTGVCVCVWVEKGQKDTNGVTLGIIPKAIFSTKWKEFSTLKGQRCLEKAHLSNDHHSLKIPPFSIYHINPTSEYCIS